MLRPAIFILLIIAIASSCRPPVFPPKPPGYFRVDTPAAHQYQVFDGEGFPYTFEYPVYARIGEDTLFKAEKARNPYWINMYFPDLGGEINITYLQISPARPYLRMMIEADSLTSFHRQKADYLNDSVYYFPDRHVSGDLYVVGGNAATRYQFTATDSVRHFIRGALYFNVTPNADSLKPATDFLVQDIKHLLYTLKWKN